MSVIDIRGITKMYGRKKNQTEVLHEIQLTVSRGEFVAITGPSGSGKSTLMNILGLLDVPDSGEYFLDGIDISSAKDGKLADMRLHHIGFVFQSFNLVQNINIRDNIELPMIYGRVHLKERRRRSKQMLEMMGIGDKLKSLPNELSGGQQQRVAIARALANQPGLILADEPTGNLDTKSGRVIMDLLKQLKDHGVTVVMITHDPGLAQQSGRVITVRDGQITYDSLAFQPAPQVIQSTSPAATGGIVVGDVAPVPAPNQGPPATYPPQPHSSRLMTLEQVAALQRKYSDMTAPNQGATKVAPPQMDTEPFPAIKDSGAEVTEQDPIINSDEKPVEPIPTAESEEHPVIQEAPQPVSPKPSLPLLATSDFYTPVPLEPQGHHPDVGSKAQDDVDGVVFLEIHHDEDEEEDT